MDALKTGAYASEELDFVKENYKVMSDDELGERLSRASANITALRLRHNWRRINRYNKEEYALYKGEEILAMGTIDEIAKATGVKESSIRFYGTPSYQKRCRGDNVRILVKI